MLYAHTRGTWCIFAQTHALKMQGMKVPLHLCNFWLGCIHTKVSKNMGKGKPVHVKLNRNTPDHCISSVHKEYMIVGTLPKSNQRFEMLVKMVHLYRSGYLAP